MEGPAVNSERLSTLINQTGFPIAVCVFLLWRLERRLDLIFRVLFQIYKRRGREPDFVKEGEET
jgi:hypothetical protein